MTLPEAPSRGLAKPPGLRTEPRVPNTLPEAPRGQGCHSAPTTSASGLMTQRRGVSSGGAWAERNQAGLCPPSRRWTRQPLRGTSRCLGPLPCFPSARPACVGLGQHPGDTAHPCCPRATRPPGRPFTPPPPQAPLACPARAYGRGLGPAGAARGPTSPARSCSPGPSPTCRLVSRAPWARREAGGPPLRPRPPSRAAWPSAAGCAQVTGHRVAASSCSSVNA